MSKMFFKFGLGLLALAGATGSLMAAVPLKTLHGHVPSAVARLATTGNVADTNTLQLAIGLQLRNQAALDQLLGQVTDPASPNYQHYLSPEDFTAQFGPSEADYQAVIDFAQAQGLKVTATHANRMLVEVTGDAQKVENAFKVKLHTYQHPTEARAFYAPDTEPSVPANLAVLDVSGLNNFAQPRPHLRFRSDATNGLSLTGANKTGTMVNAAATPRSAATPQAGSGPNGSYMGNDFRAAYAPGAPQTGAGQKIALVQFDGYFASDIATYESLNGLPAVSLTNILLNGFSGFPVSLGGNMEVSLDIEMVISMAPGISQVLVYEGSPFNFAPNVVLNQIAVDNAAKQISCSWGWTGGPSATSDQIFKEMILQGQTFFNASGDSDAFLPGQVDNPGYTGFPSSDPYITEVGATTLSTTGANGAYVSETVWNWGLIDTNYDGIGSSGGISSYYAIPYWQTNVSMTANGGSTTNRNTPDVAMVGDNIFVICLGGVQFYGVGGTSVASPLWAGFTALANQQAAAVGHAPIGFINPSLYALARSQYYTNVFRDITTGNNTWSASTNQFFAVTNYDLCTGLGAPRGTNLINALTSVTNAPLNLSAIFPPPQQPWGNTLSVMNGANPNGVWLLYIQDDSANGYGGTNFNGWFLNLTTANPIGYAGDNQLYVNTTINSQNYGTATNVPVTPGQVWHTTLAVTNYGPSISTNVYVSDLLPDATGVTLTSSSMTLGSITNYGGTLIWKLGNLAVNAGGTLTLNFQTSLPGIYTNGATVSALTTDPNPDDDSVGVTANVAYAAPPILLPQFSLGANGAFKLTVTNNPGSTVIIQASTNLLAWLPVCTNTVPFTYTNFDTTNFSKRFYRGLINQ